MLTREEADNLLDESKNELVEMLCNMIYQIDMLNDKLTAKDEEIERLKADKECANDVIKKLHHTKARSIVSMLFWEWRKHHRMYYESSKARNPSALTHLNSATLSKLMFKQAYKMSKDIK